MMQCVDVSLCDINTIFIPGSCEILEKLAAELEGHADLKAFVEIIRSKFFGVTLADGFFSFVNAMAWDRLKNCLCMALIFQLVQLVLPGALIRYLPVLLNGKHLEDAVLSGLMPVVAAIVCELLVLDLIIFRATRQSIFRQIAAGVVGLVLGSIGFHVIIVLFGAPILEYGEVHRLISSTNL
ncbi:hypothetical protein CCR75_004515 [Bremia lactucae]|uniref:Uncharacterized protein n=1 Tax=Bremia lactucae TaxID=4779 RepID=A0A976FK66_BRELC|nr:hypothetical protein CCR75_004515 [Bremia lactucae]